MKPGWISYDGGVDLLLTHLRRHLGQPQLTEMSEYLGRYFKQSRRKRHESMNDYITRKGEIYARAVRLWSVCNNDILQDRDNQFPADPILVVQQHLGRSHTVTQQVGASLSRVQGKRNPIPVQMMSSRSMMLKNRGPTRIRGVHQSGHGVPGTGVRIRNGGPINDLPIHGRKK